MITVKLVGDGRAVEITEVAASANERCWIVRVDNGVLKVATRDDSGAQSREFVTLVRVGLELKKVEVAL